MKTIFNLKVYFVAIIATLTLTSCDNEDYLIFTAQEPSEGVEFVNELNNNSLGRNIIVNGIDDFDLDQSFDLAIFSINDLQIDQENLSDYTKKIRKKIYSLSNGGWNLKILDLGIFNKGNQHSDSQFAINEILNQLSILKVKALVLNLGNNLLFDFYHASKQNNNLVNIVSVDNKVPDNSLIRKILDDDNCKLGEFSCVAYQKHINNVDEIDLFKNMLFETYSLGKIKNKLANTEPIFRNSNLMDINIRAVKSGDINNSHEFTNGLSSYEFCTLSRFAGLSSNLDLISFSSSYQSSAISSLISEGIWYAIDGMNNVIDENIDLNSENFVIYNVTVNNHDLKFVKSSITNRWWVSIENINLVQMEKSYIPCVEDDYLLSKNSILSDRILLRIKNKIS